MSRGPRSIPPLARGIFLVHILPGRKHLALDRFDLARKELELADLAKPADEEVLNLLSVVEFKRGYYNEAAQAARQLLAANSNSAILHCNLGLILFKAGVLGEAEQELRRAIELKPDHSRSHLYLGLLYRMRGKLGLAVEHLKFAGAHRVVSEIEESLRRSPREMAARSGRPTPPGRPIPIQQLSAPPPPAAASAAPEKLSDTNPSEAAANQTNPHFRPGGAPAPSGAEEIPAKIPGSPLPPPPVSTLPPPPVAVAPPPVETAPARPADPHDATFSRETSPDPRPGAQPRDTGGRPLFHVRPDGGLEIASRGVVFVRKGSVVWYSGKIRFSAEPSFRGTRLEKILRADGRGYLFVNDPGRLCLLGAVSWHIRYLEAVA